MKKNFSFSYEEYNSIEELSEADALLVTEARNATKLAYAPYSNFLVGAYASLTSGDFVKGSNQENASYPVGICAERALLASTAQLFPDVPIETLAISYRNLNGSSHIPLCPCGMCRQALKEFEMRVNQPIRLILSGMEGKVIVIAQSSQLLPLAFDGEAFS